MSADSPRRSGNRVSVSGHGSGQVVVVPRPVTDPSIIDSVTDFINEVVPQAYTSTLPGDCKETITWARFESADINDPALFPDCSSDATLPLLLVLGYNSGVQVWSIPANGEATEVLSWSQGCVRTLRILPSPASNAMRNPDAFISKRPLVALCDSAGPGPPFCSVSFISLKAGDQVKSIKFKNPVCDVVANRRSVVVTFPERIAVFDACTLEDRLSVTSCYPSPGPNSNPVTLGSRWLAFAEKKLVAWQRSSGGVGGGGAQSYTATVLHAAQTLGRGLRGLSETVASSLTGPRNHITGPVSLLGSSPPTLNGADHNTPGVVTVIDLEASSSRHNGSDESSNSGNSSCSSTSSFNGAADGVVAHFVAHNEAIVAMEFDPSGMLLLTADRRGHDFHVFRLQPHPGGSSLAAVHHLYVLHRGDTTAKVQDISFSCDSRWVAVSTLRGTTHVFPLTPYGGPVGVRTHGSPHVVNRLSRFHRSAGLSADGRSSPVPSPESPPCLPTGPHANPRLPPYPHPTVQAPLSQLRQSPHPPLAPSGTLDVSLRVCSAFASPRAWLLDSHSSHPRDGPRDSSKVLRKAVDSLFIMACHGNLVQYDLEPKPVVVGPREKICDDTQIELEVEAKAQWPLQRSPQALEVLPPLPSINPLLCGPDVRIPTTDTDNNCSSEERWLSQVEIVTHAGPHRRLWMGPQITFKTYTTTNSGSNMSLQDVEAVEVGTVPVSRPARSNPVNMPSGRRPIVPVLIESGSGSSFEQSPHLLEVYGADCGEAETWSGQGDSRLREDLADAMLESPGAPSREKGKRRYYGLVGAGGGGGGGGDEVGEGRGVRCGGSGSGPVRRVVNPGGAEITMSSDGEEPDLEQQDLPEQHWEAIAIPATAPVIPIPPETSGHPDSYGSSPREMVTTIAAAVLRRLPVQLAVQAPAKSQSTMVKKAPGKDRFQGLHVVETHDNNTCTEVSVVSSDNGSVNSKPQSRKKSSVEREVVQAMSVSVEGQKVSKSEEGKQTGKKNRGSLKDSSHNKETDTSKSATKVVMEPVEQITSNKKSKKNRITSERECVAVPQNINDKSKNEDKVQDVKSNLKEQIEWKEVGNLTVPLVETVVTPAPRKGKKSWSQVSEDAKQTGKNKSPSPEKEIQVSKEGKQEQEQEQEQEQTPEYPHEAVTVVSKKNKRKGSNTIIEQFKKEDTVKVFDEIQGEKKSSAESVDGVPKSSRKSSNYGKDDLNVDDLVEEEMKTPAEAIKDMTLVVEKVDEQTEDDSVSMDKKNRRKIPEHEHLQKDSVTECKYKVKAIIEETIPEAEGTVSLKGRKKSIQTHDDADKTFTSCDELNRQSIEEDLKEATEEESVLKEKSPERVPSVSPKKKGISKRSALQETALPESRDKVEFEVVDDTSTLMPVVSTPRKERRAWKTCAETIQDVSATLDNDKSVDTKPDVPLISSATAKSNKKAAKAARLVDKPLSDNSSEDRDREDTCEKASSADAPPQRESENCDVQEFPELPGRPVTKKAASVEQGSEECDLRPAPATGGKKGKKGSQSVDTNSCEKKVTESVEAEPEICQPPVASTKPKRGWELPSVTNKSQNVRKEASPPPVALDVDIDKLTFEDLEAIVDAARKEDENKSDQTCLKENKNSEKNEGSVLIAKKCKGKENVEEEIAPDSKVGPEEVLVIEPPKAIEEPIKQDEPVKAPEKPVCTQNRGSKAQRRKRR